MKKYFSLSSQSSICFSKIPERKTEAHDTELPFIFDINWQPLSPESETERDKRSMFVALWVKWHVLTTNWRWSKPSLLSGQSLSSNQFQKQQQQESLFLDRPSISSFLQQNMQYLLLPSTITWPFLKKVYVFPPQCLSRESISSDYQNSIYDKLSAVTTSKKALPAKKKRAKCGWGRT